MNHSETLSIILSKDQTILHFSHNEERLDKYQKFKNYKTIGITDDSDIKISLNQTINPEILQGFDLIVLSSYLEIIDNPIELIQQIKNLSETVCIYEYKYDLMSDCDPEWKKHWSRIGLTWNLTQHFDLINELYFEEATLHTCKIPHTVDENKKRELENVTQ